MPPFYTHTEDEEQLVRSCREGHAPAQRQLYEQYVEPLMVQCLRYVPLPQEAQEVLMDGFVQAFRHIGNFEYRGPGSLKAWLKKIMVNQCLMHLRKKKQRLVDAEQVEAHVAMAYEDPLLERLSAKELVLLIQELPDGYRLVFNLYVFEEMGHKEIAALLGISENTSKSQLHKARQQLRQKLEHLNIAKR